MAGLNRPRKILGGSAAILSAYVHEARCAGKVAMKLERHGEIAILYIDTERNNAINIDSIREAHELMNEAEQDRAVRAIVVTSTHKSIFCPGVDLPSLMNYSRAEMREFYDALTGLVRRKFVYPKAEIYALNGHTIAAGLMMALAGDYRIMANGKFYLGLMEIELGLATPIGVVAMLAHVLGGRGAERVLFRGERYPPEQARAFGLVDEVVESNMLMDRAMEHARLLGQKPVDGYRRLKRYSRQAVADRMQALDAAHFDDLVEQWFAPETQELVNCAVRRMTKPASPVAAA
jgi:Delta3-Delta2-enoyl-CoA isomerase